MSVYKQVSKNLNFVDREKEVEKFWKDNDIFKKSIKIREGCPTYTFYDGPPTANGKPHIGHVETRTIKDMIPRYRTMKGYQVPRKAGWDTHGLPVELEVEKLLGLDGKEQIEEYGLAPFIDKCKESVWKYKGMWEDFSATVGFWADMDDPYVTYNDDFIESEWWALKEIWEKGLLYKGFKIVPYCPRCGTPLSSHEVAQGYKNVKERSAVVRFKVQDEDAYFLAWTTTPWTLPSNVALCVNPSETYAKVKAADGYTYYMAEALLDNVLGSLSKDGEKAYEVLKTYKGTELERKAYEPLFSCAGEAAARQKKAAHFVTVDDYVTMTDGTGIVHIAPAFGEDDSRIGRNYDLPFVQFVDGKGNLTEETPYAGKFVKDADPDILKDLDKENKLFAAPKFEHDYPFCWRCDTPLIYYARESWYIKMTAVKDDLVANNKTINWIPPSIGEGRFGNWLENIQDWAVSRNRYWGTPLNIWECEGCGKRHSIGSRAELYEMSKDEKAKTVEFHRPYIDEITLTCPDCGKTMKRVPEVIDCWFDSGAMPFAQHHYPFENKELFEAQFPAAFISEAVDQTRGWFYSLLAESTLLFNKSPYENVIVMGHVQDENGQKMSKSKGNAVDPFDALAEYGADAIRWYFYTSAAPWLPKRFSGKIVTEGQNNFMAKLWNTYSFFVLYANIDDFDATKYTLEYDKLPIMDKWLLSKLNSVVGEVDESLNLYRIPEAAKALQSFVDEMSNWYVRRSRERFWAGGMEQDKINAYMTLYTALVTISKAAAPMIPFMTEEIYQNLVRSIDKNAPESIHLTDFPAVNDAFIDKELEASMETVLDASNMGHAAREEAVIKNRQPLNRMYIKTENKLSEFYTDIIKDELNVKEVVYADDVSGFTSYSFKPQLKTLGPKYGKLIGTIKNALSELDGSAAYTGLKAEGKLSLNVEGSDIELSEDDLLIESVKKEGYVTKEDNLMTVVLDVNLTPELIEEGYVNEIISKVQNMRKDSGFEVMDHIRISINGNDKLYDIVMKNAEDIKRKVLAESISKGESFKNSGDWNINGEDVTITLEKI
ncbi:MAG: isoleucine--tRNA ligase [Lachnospiraceae bacterium]|nr:isoleucine--tRNA ligase [Lachnospiraceae bacterium]